MIKFFGQVPWPKPRENAASQEQNGIPFGVKFFNILWSVTFGLILCISYLVIAAICIMTIIGKKYGFKMVNLAFFMLNPFSRLLSYDDNEFSLYHQKPGCFYVPFKIIVTLTLLPLHLCLALINWFFVFSIPMAKFNVDMIPILLRDPLNVRLDSGYNIKCLTHSAVQFFYFRHSTFGVNVVFLNSLAIVFLTLICSYTDTSDIALVVLSIISTVPIVYFLGLSLANISAQTSPIVGAIITATFGSIVDIILYTSALLHGDLVEMIQAAIVGNLLAALLLIPAVGMIAGGLRFRERRFNTESAGVSSVMLLTSLVGAFSPTLFYQAYGSSAWHCQFCTNQTSCYGCVKIPVPLNQDPAFMDKGRYLMYVCAGILPLAYIIGLIFTLRKPVPTPIQDREMIEAPQNIQVEQVNHEIEASWSVKFSVFVLLIMTVLFSFISEILTDRIDPVIKGIGISQSFTGIVVLGLITNLVELANAVQFALEDNIQLAIEIGSSVSIQIALLQMPIMVLISLIVNRGVGFTLIFPLVEVFAVIFSVLILNRLTTDGRSTYFLGSSLFIIYILIVVSFYFVK